MPASFEQQRELIATFRSVARSLLAVPVGLPVVFEDLEGDLLRRRVRTVTLRLIATGLIKETKETKPGTKFWHLVWRLADEPARGLLLRIVESNEQTSKFLWPNEESLPMLEEAQAEEAAAEESPPQDPVALVAQVLEGFNDRIQRMEERQSELVGGMRELVVAVTNLTAKVKPYDDTELLLALNDQAESNKAVRALVESQDAVLKEIRPALLELAAATGRVNFMMDELVKNGIQVKNQQMLDYFATMAQAFRKITEEFKSWSPAMEECIAGLRIVNANQHASTEETNSMLMAVLQAMGAQARGEKFSVKVAPVVAPTSLRKRGSALPTLSAMFEKKDLEKKGKRSFDVTLPDAISAQVTVEPKQELEAIATRPDAEEKREKFTF